MDVFKFRKHLVDEYSDFTRSFTRIKADDIRNFVDAQYDSQKFWPEPLVQVNPNFKEGGTVESFVDAGHLHPLCAEIFRFGKSAASAGHSLPLHKHQAEALSLAASGESYVLTTGTGSGKSLAYFIPIVDACLKAKEADPTRRTRAIVVYPMNALANSQLEELKKFLGTDPASRPVTFGRFTGQEGQEEREAMKANPPDILLTNFMMLELLLTRQNAIDQQVIANARGLRFLVLDELHTYRGRQGADVALLVRRVREALADQLVCIGTSATMATDGTEMERNATVARVASRLFGTPIPARNIVTETLRRTTPEAETEKTVAPKLAAAILAGVPQDLPFEAMAKHPVSVWVELTLGLSYESNKPRRAKPKTLKQAASLLAQAAGLPEPQCSDYLQKFLLRAYNVTDLTGKSLFAFKLHQFISGGGKVYTTLEAPGKRVVTLDGQQFVAGDRSRHLYNIHFCRDCGQEYVPVWNAEGPEGRVFQRRSIEERQHEDDVVKFGFLMPDVSQSWNDADPERYPENWLEERADSEWRVKSTYKQYVPQAVQVRPDGVRTTSEGLNAWFIPGGFRFCLACGTAHTVSGKDALRLTSLSGEGRSSATTMLTLSSLRYLYEQDQELSQEAKKVLGFSDNRQDAALQSGHFNDFLQVLLTRAALLAAIEKNNGAVLSEKEIANAVFEAIGFHRDDAGVRAEYMQQPDVKGNTRRQVQDAMRAILGYRSFYDLRRGWRFNNPNLEQLGLVRIAYQDIDDLAADESEWASAPQVLQSARPAERARVLQRLFETMRQGLCVATRYLDGTELDQLRTLSFANLCEPWGFTEDERPVPAKWFVLSRPRDDAGPRGRKLKIDDYLVIGSSRSRLGRELRKGSTWGGGNPHYKQINDKTYPAVIEALLKAAKSYGLVRNEETDVGLTGWQVNGSKLLWTAGNGASPSQSHDNIFFRSLYRNIARLLADPAHQLFEFEAREHNPAFTLRPQYWVDQCQVLARIARVPSRVANAWLAWYKVWQLAENESPSAASPGHDGESLSVSQPVEDSADKLTLALAGWVAGELFRRAAGASGAAALASASLWEARALPKPPAPQGWTNQQRQHGLRSTEHVLVESYPAFNRMLKAVYPTSTQLLGALTKWAQQDDPAQGLSLSDVELAELQALQQPAIAIERGTAGAVQISANSQLGLKFLNTWMDRRSPRWLMGWRDITNAAAERTVIASVVPRVGVAHTMPLLWTRQPPAQQAALLANWNSMVFDYIARQKVGGTHLTYGYLKQFPVLPPECYLVADLAFIVPRILELTFTAHALQAWAEDLAAYDPRRAVERATPFSWNPERRAQLRAELDAYYARLYKLTRDELRYILDPADVMGADYPSETFRVLKKNEINEFGEYRTRRLVLEAWDSLAAGTISPQPADVGGASPVYSEQGVIRNKQEAEFAGLVAALISLSTEGISVSGLQDVVAHVPMAATYLKSADSARLGVLAETVDALSLKTVLTLIPHIVQRVEASGAIVRRRSGNTSLYFAGTSALPSDVLSRPEHAEIAQLMLRLEASRALLQRSEFDEAEKSQQAQGSR